MTDTNNVVIKINYKSGDKSPYKRDETEMVTEWHIQRIVLAFILLVIFILLPFYYFNDDSFEQEPEELTVVKENNKDVKSVINNIPKAGNTKPEKLEVIKEIEKGVSSNETTKKQLTVFNEKSVDDIKTVEKLMPEANSVIALVNNRIVRAMLTTGLNNKEPLGKIISPVIVNKNKVARVFYFTEIADMKGRALYHHWLWNDRVVYNRKINISGDRWRATTSKLIPYSKAGNWSVRLVNESDSILNEIKFKVIQE